LTLIFRVCVHAIPASDAEEYQGMPMFAEVGPIQLDPKTQQQADEQIENSESDGIPFEVQIDKTVGLEELSALSRQKVTLRVNNGRQIEVENQGVTFWKGEGMRLSIQKHVNNKAELL